MKARLRKAVDVGPVDESDFDAPIDDSAALPQSIRLWLPTRSPILV